MKKLASCIETDSFGWEVEVQIQENENHASLWQMNLIFDSDTVVLPRMTRGQVRLMCDALRRAMVVASVKVNPLDGWDDKDL